MINSNHIKEQSILPKEASKCPKIYHGKWIDKLEQPNEGNFTTAQRNTRLQLRKDYNSLRANEASQQEAGRVCISRRPRRKMERPMEPAATKAYTRSEKACSSGTPEWTCNQSQVRRHKRSTNYGIQPVE